MRNIRRNAALIASTAVIASVGIGGVMAAKANDSTSPDKSTVQTPGNGAEETSDGPDQGPDANPNEPGHQDANESGEADEADGAEEADGAKEADGPDQGRPDANLNEPGHQDANESGEADEADGAEETSDGADQGPDANPNEPGHQDADESGEGN